MASPISITKPCETPHTLTYFLAFGNGFDDGLRERCAAYSQTAKTAFAKMVLLADLSEQSAEDSAIAAIAADSEAHFVSSTGLLRLSAAATQAQMSVMSSESS